VPSLRDRRSVFPIIPPGTAGVCRRRDAVRVLGEHRVREALRSGEFSSPWTGVLVDPACAAEPSTVIAAGWLASGPDAIVTGPTAAFLYGYTAAEPTPVHVVVRYGSKRRTRPGLVVHNGRSLDADARMIDGLPVLCLERVVTDLLCTAAPAGALAVTDQVLAGLAPNARPAFRDEIHQRLRERPDPRGTRIGSRLLDLATGAAESPAESWLLWRIVDLGFPVPTVNHWVCTIDGEPRFRVDLSWPELRIAIEYYGHLSHDGREELDEARILELERRGWIVVVVRADDLSSMSRVEREIDEAFRRRGMHPRERIGGALRARRHREPRAG
jgi:hypothetical protein